MCEHNLLYDRLKANAQRKFEEYTRSRERMHDSTSHESLDDRIRDHTRLGAEWRRLDKEATDLWVEIRNGRCCGRLFLRQGGSPELQFRGRSGHWVGKIYYPPDEDQ